MTRVVLACAALLLLVVGCSTDSRSDATQSGHTTATLATLDPDPITTNPTPQLPVTVRSADGADVTITDTSRIVAIDLYGTIAQTVYALGLGDNLVGRSTSATFPAIDDVTNVTPGGQNVSVEAVAALRPTVVLTDASIGDDTVRQQLRTFAPVVLFDPKRSVDGVADSIRSVAAALGVSDAGAQLADRTQQEIDDAKAIVRAPADPLKIAFLYLRGSSIAFLAGPGSGADSIIEALGAEDAGTASGMTSEFVQVNSEAMIAAAPDVLLTMTDGLESAGGTEGLQKMPGVGQTPAGKNQRVVDMADGALLSFGPNTGHVLAALADAIYTPDR